MKRLFAFVIMLIIVSSLGACRSEDNLASAPAQSNNLKILAVESFLADMARNVAGNRATVDTLIPLGLDPHAFEPAPKDVSRIAESDVLIVNGAGVEAWLDETLQNAGGERQMIIASNGLTPRAAAEREAAHTEDEQEQHGEEDADTIDPHFWFDPVLAVQYVENIRDGLIAVDPAGKDIYTENAKTYIAILSGLNEWALEQINQLPPEKRLMVTNHESFGYFADRYGFTIVGAVLPSVSTSAAPSAKQVADLIQAMRASGAKVIFLETGSNTDLAQQIAEEIGAKVVTDLYSHSLSDAGGPASTYVEMMRYNIAKIVAALK